MISFTWPIIFPKVLFFDLAISKHQFGFDIKSKTFAIFILIGTDNPFLMSACLWPSICKSKVSTNAEHSAAFALSTNRLAKS